MTKARALLFVACATAGGSTLLASACATNQDTPAEGSKPTVVVGTDAADDASREEDADGEPDGEVAEVDAGSCTDCEYFPEPCSSDVLCPNGPFDPSGNTGLDRRTQITVIRGRAMNDVWAAGGLGALAHFDGTSWTVSDP